jgi:hypothetical protein
MRIWIHNTGLYTEEKPYYHELTLTEIPFQLEYLFINEFLHHFEIKHFFLRKSGDLIFFSYEWQSNFLLIGILFRGFLQVIRSQIKHNILRGLFTITITNYSTISLFPTSY